MTTAVVNPFWQLPVAPQPPNDPTFWLLNGRVGWQAAELDNVSVTDDRLGLLVVPGSGRLLTESSGSFGGIVSPGNVAVGPDQSIYLLDCTAGKLKKFDGCSCQFLTVPCLGGIGTGPRQVQSPHGIGISSGNLFICDTGNHRLLVFSLFGMVLRDIWTPPASTGLPNVWQPFAIAFDNRGHAYVSDPANGVIHRFHPTGRYEGFLSGFGAISWITFDCRNQLYSISQGQTTVTISGKDGKKLGTASRPEEIAANFPPLPFTVDAYGDLNLSRLCNPLVGTGVFGPTGTPLTSPPPDPPLVFNTSGTYWSNALDSEIYRCQWHRIVLHGNLPRKTMVYISTYSSEISQPFEQIQALPDSSWQTNMSITSLSGEWEGLIFSGPGRYLWLRVQLSGNGTATPSISTMRIEYPRISLRRFLPAVFAEDPNGASFTDRFLSIFDTTLRSLERKIDDQARYFDPLSAPDKPLVPGTVDFLTWLASWIGVSLDRQTPLKQRRLLLKQAGKLLSIRGTRFGLWKQLLMFLGMQPDQVCYPNDGPKKTCLPKPLNCSPAPKKSCAWEPPNLILENYQLRRWLSLGQGRLGDDALLWGKRIVNRSQLSNNAQLGTTQLITTPDPFHDPFLVYANKFTVFVPAAVGTADQKKRGLINLLEAEKPAHTQYQIEYVSARMRIGFQSMIGLDSVVGRYPSGYKVGQALGRDSVLSGAPLHGGPSFSIGRNSRIGEGSKLD